MRSPPEHVDVREVADLIGRHFGLEVGELDYLPEGGGAYHWVTQSGDGRRWFLTCDDLDTKAWFGSDRDSVFAGLVAAYRTAIDLRDKTGRGFVLAPLLSVSGDAAVRLDDRYSVAVLPFVEGEPGRWGQPIDPAGRSRMVGLLADLHNSPGPGHPGGIDAPRRGLELPGRRSLEAALSELDRPWTDGPLADLARQEFATHADLIAGWLAAFDQLASRIDGSGYEAVITHGEPHPGNLIRTGDGFFLIDWDTVAIARPERDLWMLDDDSGEARAEYQDLTGRALDPDGLALYRLLWALADVAAFTVDLRGAHQRNDDSDHALASLESIFSGRGPAPYG